MALRRSRMRLVTNTAEPDGLLLQAATGDRGAYSDLYDLVINRVYGIARTVVRDLDMAEEIAQEVMVEVWRKAPQFDRNQGSALTWISTIAHRRAVDRVRREQSRRNREERSFEHTPETPDVSDDLVTAEDHSEVNAALSSLSETQREAVRLAFYDGRTHVEISEILEIPLGTAKTRIRDGLIKLRDAVAEERSA